MPRFRNLGELLLITGQSLGILDSTEESLGLQRILEDLALRDSIDPELWDRIFRFLEERIAIDFPDQFWISSANLKKILAVYRELVIRVALHQSSQHGADFFLAMELLGTGAVLLGRYLLDHANDLPDLFNDDPFWFIPLNRKTSPVKTVLTFAASRLALRDTKDLAKWLAGKIESREWTVKELQKFFHKWESGTAIATGDLLDLLFPETLEAPEDLSWARVKMLIRLAQMFRFLQNLFETHFSQEEAEFLFRSFEETCTLEVQGGVQGQGIPLPCDTESSETFIGHYFGALELRILEYEDRNKTTETPPPRELIMELDAETLLDRIPSAEEMAEIESKMDELRALSPWNRVYDFVIAQYEARIHLYHRRWEPAMNEYRKAVRAVRLRGGPKTREILEEASLLAMMESDQEITDELTRWIELYDLTELKENLTAFQTKTRSFGIGVTMEKTPADNPLKTRAVPPLEEQIQYRDLYDKVFSPEDLTEENVHKWLISSENGRRNRLMLAAYLGSESTVQKCLTLGADPNLTGDSHTTALTLAVDEYLYHRQIQADSPKTRKYMKILEVLLNHDLNPSINVTSEDRETVLHRFVKAVNMEDSRREELFELIKKVIRHRPDLGLKDHKGRTPGDLAKEREAYEILAWFQEIDES